MSHEVVRALCHRVVDYAGTFPPAELELADACERYARYRSGGDAWMLNRFVVSARDLDALPSSADGARWPLSVVCRDAEDVARARAWRGGTIESLETARLVDSERPVFVEHALPVEPTDLDALRERRAMLKIRLGGDAIPATPAVASALSACAASKVSLKATAGLHRALRSETHGFLNLLLAATLARAGGNLAQIEAVLDETDATSFSFESDTARWHGHRFDAPAIARGRELLRSFGSCSFEEPLESLDALELLR